MEKSPFEKIYGAGKLEEKEPPKEISREEIKTGYQKLKSEFKSLKEEFDLEVGKAFETGDLTRLEELTAALKDIEKRRAALAKKLWEIKWSLYNPKEIKEVKRKEKYKVAETLKGHTDWVYTLQVLPDGRIVSGSQDKTIKIWKRDPENNNEYIAKETLKGHTDCVLTLQVLPDGWIVSGSEDKTIKIWD